MPQQCTQGTRRLTQPRCARRARTAQARRPLHARPRRILHPSFLAVAAATLVLCGLLLRAAGAVPCTPSSAPILYHTSQYQSPVRGEPGDLLLLPGAQFRPQAMVVYAKVKNLTQPPLPPATVPADQTEEQGHLVPLAVDDDCDKDVPPPGQVLAPAVKIILPRMMHTDQAYALWVANPDPSGSTYHFSNGILINDARPMWLSPGPSSQANASPYPFLYRTAPRPGLQRELKVVGRNLQPLPSTVTRVWLRQLNGPGSYILTAATDPSTQHFVARVTVPAFQANELGDYSVGVSREGKRDDENWVWLNRGGPALHISPDPKPRAQFDVSTFADAHSGPCQGNDDQDDTLCITRAIRAAAAHGGGDVVFPRGRWILNRSCWHRRTFQPVTDPRGQYALCQAVESAGGRGSIVVPAGVNLVAAQKGGAVIETDKEFDQPYLDWYKRDVPERLAAYSTTRVTVFQLQGNNLVSGLRFHDSYRPSSVDSVWGPGPGSQTLMLYGNDITIEGNIFDDVFEAIKADWNQLPHSLLGPGVTGHAGIVITGNKFGAYHNAADFSALEESVIANNVFWPGASEVPVAIGVPGSRHLDVSSNVVDGTNRDYIDRYGVSSVGWRAGFFFSSSTSHEHLLVANNKFACIGTRGGQVKQDGEAIATDKNRDLAGFKVGETVVGPAGSVTEVIVSPSPGEMLFVDAAGNVDGARYRGRWLRVDYGPGLGQARKITGVEKWGQDGVKFTVGPAFDVAPVPGVSRILVTQQAWQMYIVGNEVDNTCAATMLPPAYWGYWSGGLIGMYASATDSAIASNKQVDTAGIMLSVRYLRDQGKDTFTTPISLYFIEVRDNTIVGSFGSSNGVPHPKNNVGSGIHLTTQVGLIDASGTLMVTPDILGYGVSISRNTLQHVALANASGGHSGVSYPAVVAVSMGGAWGAESPHTPGYVATLIFGNTISAVVPAVPAPATGNPHAFGIVNGEGSPNYPQGTVICRNQVTEVTQACWDVPPPGPRGQLCPTPIVCP